MTTAATTTPTAEILNQDTGLATRYDAGGLEPAVAERWEKSGCFTPSMQGEPFAIMMPPPNVTGTLHLGHALDNTLPDILVRRARMQGKNALYQPGTDHASIAVHVVLERQWAKDGKTRFDYGREAFMEKAWEWKDKSAGTIGGQLRRLGISCDWKNERFTMDPQYSAAISHVFIELYNRGLIYRGQRLVNWDPKMQTAVSDLEVKHKQVNGHLWHVRYKFAGDFTYDGKDGIEIATTRPETILADGAIAIHPDDVRAKDLVGKTVVVPMVNREIPIVADDMVDPEFGSGFVKITAAHDFNDFAFYQRHKDSVNIPLINLLTPDAKMNTNCPAQYAGLDRFEARKRIVADLDAMGQLMKFEEHVHNVGHAERDETVLEPYLTWQWYVKGEPLAKKCLEAADKGELTFVNERDSRVYRHWLENIQDWCISRQLWWGHRIPAWFKDVAGSSEPEIYVGEKAPEGEGWTQDGDILDTWFSSALWPFVTQGWPHGGERLQAFYPGEVVMSGRDILFFWLVRMVMMGTELTGQVPFSKIYTHGLILDEHGQKMSKSKGNVLDPLELINEYGTDALRMTMASIASAEDMRFSTAKVEQNRNFCTKLWNAARFLGMQDITFTDDEAKAFDVRKVSHPVNLWLIGELKAMFAQLDAHLDAYEFNQAGQLVYHFTWGTWCDWYLELTKPLLAGQMGADVQAETKGVVGWGFDNLLRGLSPFIPFITEQLWQNHTVHDNAFLMLQRWPKYAAWSTDDAATQRVRKMIDVVGAIRQTRTTHKLSPKTELAVQVRGASEADLAALQSEVALLRAVAGVSAIEGRTDAARTGEAAAVVDGVEYIMDLSGHIDLDAEKKRLEREVEKQQKELDKINTMLGNPNFVERAPADVLATNRSRLTELTDNLAKLRAMLAE
ncbi:MAG: valine--tRNA ligase [Alphaproteobacteria bacterium]|nr:MAG: valine--tRNA ligase [Alphaproteobacteria bacterium]